MRIPVVRLSIRELLRGSVHSSRVICPPEQYFFLDWYPERSPCNECGQKEPKLLFGKMRDSRMRKTTVEMVSLIELSHAESCGHPNELSTIL